ncbi:undecaprenyl-diphosphatase [Effusibacillus pohliae]|uniref:undecaprenyl-diphosphatase n=1 Tax=Effusibacillus pohliae TaxID=232270 RepID=UPI00037F1269|nr:undecaprenyl-diphosphatase [Effusibacillus pohliae]
MNEQLFQSINQWAGHFAWLDEPMILLTKYAPLLFAGLLLWLWLRGGRQRERNVLYAAITAALALLINQLIGAVYFHPRPFMLHAVHQLVPHAPDNSFPSDHATGAFALAVAVYLRNRKWGYGMLGLAVAIAFSRVFVGVHYPADVIGGAVVGLVSSLLVARGERVLEPMIRVVLRVYAKIAGRVPFLAERYVLDEETRVG